MSDAKVYLVSAGCYSDYRVLAAFSTQELADAYKAAYDARQSWHGAEPSPSYDEASVEEWDLDVPHEWPMGAYEATVLEDGTVAWIWWAERADPNTSARTDYDKYRRCRTFIGTGPTREHARRSAEEFRRVTLTTPTHEATP